MSNKDFGFDFIDFSNEPEEVVRERARQAIKEIREKAAIDFPNRISLEEINEEIAKVRRREPDE